MKDKDFKIPQELIDKLKTQSDVEDLLGGIYQELVQKMLESEMDEHLGYQKHDRISRQVNN